MSKVVGAGRQGQNNTRAAPHHSDNLGHNVVAIAKALSVLAPDDNTDQVCKAFNNRTSYGVIRSWRDGRRYMPTWAVELMQHKLTGALDATKQIARGPGQRAGLRNMPHEIRQR